MSKVKQLNASERPRKELLSVKLLHLRTKYHTGVQIPTTCIRVFSTPTCTRIPCRHFCRKWASLSRNDSPIQVHHTSLNRFTLRSRSQCIQLIPTNTRITHVDIAPRFGCMLASSFPIHRQQISADRQTEAFGRIGLLLQVELNRMHLPPSVFAGSLLLPSAPLPTSFCCYRSDYAISTAVFFWTCRSRRLSRPRLGFLNC